MMDFDVPFGSGDGMNPIMTVSIVVFDILILGAIGRGSSSG